MSGNTKIRTIPTRSRAGSRATTATAPGSVAQFRTVCANCNLRELCQPCCGLSAAERELAERVMFRRARLRRGEYLYRSGDRFTALYALRNGFFKSTAQLGNGREQVTGFALIGEVLGLDGIASEKHTCDAVALEDSEVCAIPFAGLQEAALALPSLQRHFFKTMSREIEREHGAMLRLGSMNAEERLAMFLLNLSRRYAARGYSSSEFHLRMTREEIGSYLGLKLETISRTFSKFQDEGLISVRQRFVRIQNSTGLEQVMGREQARTRT